MAPLLPTQSRERQSPGLDGSLPVNPTVPEFEEIVAWGARPHLFRKGGPAVNSGPPLRFPHMSPGVRRLARLVGPVGTDRESRTLPGHASH